MSERRYEGLIARRDQLEREWKMACAEVEEFQRDARAEKLSSYRDQLHRALRCCGVDDDWLADDDLDHYEDLMEMTWFDAIKYSLDLYQGFKQK